MFAARTRPRMGRVAFKADHQTLARALAYVNAIPDLHEGAYVQLVLLTATGQHVAVARNNGHVQFHADVTGAEPVQAGVAAVNGRQLADALNGLPVHTGLVAVVVDGRIATVTPGVVDAVPVHLAWHDPAELADRTPDLPDVTTTATVGLASLVAGADTCGRVATAEYLDMPVLAHTHVELARSGGGWMRLAATDKRRLVRRDVPVLAQDGGFKATVNAAELAAAAHALDHASARVGQGGGEGLASLDYARAENRLVLTCGPYRAVLECWPAGRYAVNFPARGLERLIAEAAARSADVVCVAVADVAGAVRRLVKDVKAQAKAAKTQVAEPAIALTFADGGVDMAAAAPLTPSGPPVWARGLAANTRIECGYAGPGWRVAMVADRLLAALDAVDAPRVRWHLPRGVDGWDTQPWLWEPAHDDGTAYVGAALVVKPAAVGAGFGLGRPAGEQESTDDAGTVPAQETEEETVKFEDKVTVIHVGENGVSAVPNPWAEKPDPAELERMAWERMNGQDFAGALEVVNRLVDVCGADTLKQDEDEAQFTWGQVRDHLMGLVAEQVAAEVDAQADGAAEEPDAEPEQPARPAKAAKATTARKATGRKAAAKPAKAAPQPAKRAAAKAAPVVTVDPPADPDDDGPLVSPEQVPAVVGAVTGELQRQGLPEAVIVERLEAVLEALRISGAALAAACEVRPTATATRHRATVRRAPATAMPAPAGTPSAPRRQTTPVVEGTVEGDALRYELPRGTRVKATATALRKALAAAERERKETIGFHVAIQRGDEDNPAHALLITADVDGGVATVAALAGQVAAQVISEMASELVAA